MKQKLLEIDDPKKVAELTDCYRKIDYYYDMIAIAEAKRDSLIMNMSLSDIKAACDRSERKILY